MVTLPKPQTSGAKSAGRFVKPDFVYLVKDDVYRCPAGEKLTHHFTADEDGQKMRIYLTKACRTCPLKNRCTTANERRIKRWEHEHVVEAAQTRLDQNPQAMRIRRETVELSRDRACVHRVSPSSNNSKSHNECEDTYELISICLIRHWRDVRGRDIRSP